MEKTKLIKIFLLYVLRWTGCLMIPLTTPYDEYIDMPELTLQKTSSAYSSCCAMVGRNNKMSRYQYEAEKKQIYELK